MFPKPFVTVSLTRETHLFKSLKRRVDDPLSILRRSCYVVCHTSGAARRMKRIKKIRRSLNLSAGVLGAQTTYVI